MDKVLLWASPARFMEGRGRFEWRVIVYAIAGAAPWPGRGPYVGYEWRPFGSNHWKSETEWPSYDVDNGATAGLPPVTRDLYQVNRLSIDSIKAEHAPATEPTQAGLQYVIPGCEKDRTRSRAAQLDLF